MGFENYSAEVIIRTRQFVGLRTISLSQRSRSQLALKVCAFQNCVQPITLSCMVGFKQYLADMFIMTRQYVACKNMSLGQRSRLQFTLKVCAFQIYVRPITSSCVVGLEKYLAEMIITTRQCVMCKNHVSGQRSRSQSTLTVCA